MKVSEINAGDTIGGQVVESIVAGPARVAVPHLGIYDVAAGEALVIYAPTVEALAAVAVDPAELERLRAKIVANAIDLLPKGPHAVHAALVPLVDALVAATDGRRAPLQSVSVFALDGEVDG